MKKIGVTGAAGFIGSYVVEELHRRGYDVLVMDHALPGTVGIHDFEVETFFGDVRDETAVFEFAAHVDGIIHLAAVLGTQETIQNPKPSVETNIMGSLNIFEAAARYDLPVVYAGVGNHFMAPQAGGSYTITKTTAEYFAKTYNANKGSRISVVRPVNAYGPRQSVASPYGCLDPSTPVLTEDLSWVPISSLREGDRLVGIDEYPESKYRQRKLRSVEVTGSWATEKEAVRLSFSDGRSVVCSVDHPWLTTSWLNTNANGWKRAGDLRAGLRIASVVDSTWARGEERLHGYVSGLLDGEAHTSKSGVFFHQNPGKTLDAYISAVQSLGFSTATHSKGQDRKCLTTNIVGGVGQRMKFLGTVGTERLNTNVVWEGLAPHGGYVELVKIEPLGKRPLWDIETSNHTYIAEGLVSHNSSKVRKILPSFTCRALAGDDIEVYGDGTQISDCVHVWDVANVFVSALEYTEGVGPLTDLEVGPVSSITVNDIANLVRQAAKSEVKLTHLPMRPGEVPNAVVKANVDSLAPLGINAENFIPLGTGIEETVEWYRENWLPGYLEAQK